MATVDPLHGQPFGRYFLLKKLATGGMGELFLAKATGAAGFEKRLVIKKILPHLAQNETFVKRFIDEAKIVVQLHHGNIISVIDMGVVDSEYYIAMEYVDGRDLRDLLKYCAIKERSIPWDLTLYILAEVLKGLSYAHNKCDDDGRNLRIIHRDVSPSNVLVSREGEVKILDFGIAKAAEKSSESISGMLQGKFLYMSPEQAAGEAADHRSDLFSVGTLAYEMLTGKRPFAGHSDLETLGKVRTLDVPPPSKHKPGLSPAIDKLVLKALQKKPGDRFQTAEAFQLQMSNLLFEGQAQVTPAKVADFFQVPLRRSQHRQMTLDDLISMGLSDSLPEGKMDRTLTRDVDSANRQGSSPTLSTSRPAPRVVPLPEEPEYSAPTPDPGASSPAIVVQKSNPRYQLPLTLGLLGLIAVLLGVNVWAQLRIDTVRMRDMRISIPAIVVPDKPKKPTPPKKNPIITKPTPKPVIKKPTYRVLQLKRLPAKAVVIIDNKRVEASRDGNYRIAIGREVNVKVRLPRLAKPWTRRISASSPSPVELVVTLKAKQRMVTVTVDPVSAKLKVAGHGNAHKTGTVKLKLSEGGTKRVSASAEGYLPGQIVVRWRDNRKSYKITLRSRDRGKVQLWVMPRDATATIRGNVVQGGRPRTISAPVGNQRVVFRYKNYKPILRTIEVRKNKITKISRIDFTTMKKPPEHPKKK